MKPKPSGADPRPIEQRLHEWLENQGYPLEMRVAKAFQAAGARVIQSEYYVDPVKDESREIDVVADWQQRLDDTLVTITFVVECKSSKDKPWILFVSPEARLNDRARVAQRAASRLGRQVLSMIARESSAQDLPIFRLPDAPAYSITQAFTSNHDLCYAAATTVAGACFAQAREADRPVANALIRRQNLEIILPVLVTEARLFAASLQQDSSVSLVERTSGVLLWRNPIVGLSHTVIHVLTLPALEQFIADARTSAERFIALCRSDYREAIEKATKLLRAETSVERRL
jgi:hypothetical protein